MKARPGGQVKPETGKMEDFASEQLAQTTTMGTSGGKQGGGK